MRRILVLLLLAAAACSKHTAPERFPDVGDQLPVFSVMTDSGETVTSDDLSSGVSLLVFFHTDCPDCRKELEWIQKLYEKAGSLFTLLLVSRGESAQEISSYWSEKGYTMPYSAQLNRKLYSLFSDSGIPYSVTVRDGTIVQLDKESVPYGFVDYLEKEFHIDVNIFFEL